MSIFPPPQSILAGAENCKIFLAENEGFRLALVLVLVLELPATTGDEDENEDEDD